VVAGLLLLAACTESGQSGSAFVFLSVDFFSLDGSNPVGSVTSSRADLHASTAVCATLRNNLKNPTVTAPTGLDSVFIESYTVTLSRADGGPVPGSVTINTALTVPSGTVANGAISGNTAILGVLVVLAQSKGQPPLSSAPVPLNMSAFVTFRGRDGRGQRVETSGGVSVLLVGSGSDSVAACAGGGGGASSSSSSSSSSVSSSSSSSSS
jgi:hypothetical protein